MSPSFGNNAQISTCLFDLRLAKTWMMTAAFALV